MQKVSQGLPGQEKNIFMSADIADILNSTEQKHVGTHSRVMDYPLPESQILKTWDEKISAAGNFADRSAYIHIPFCRLKCLYCGFFKNYYDRPRTERYVKALLQDIKMSGQKEYCHAKPLKAVYFGGGTPGVMNADEIKEVLGALKENISLADDCEITFETSLSDLDDEQLAACIDSGVNRFSLGVQTFNTAIRQGLGRIDNEKRLVSRLDELVTKQDKAAIVIDLIYGLPGQTSELWQYDLDTAVGLGLHGFDTYALSVLPKSKLAELIREGKMPAVPPKSKQTEYFAMAIQKLEKAGMRRLSICHWGRFDLKERNVYNRLSKGACGKIPFGAGAGGSIDGWRVRLLGDADDYEKCIAEGHKPIAMMAKPSENYEQTTYIKYAMDMGFIVLDHLPERLIKAADAVLQSWEEKGFVNRARGINELTLLGQFWHGELTQMLMDFLQQEFDKEICA